MSTEHDENIARWRNSIDNLDAALIHLVAERFKLTQQVGAYKAEHKLSPSDPGREKVQIARLRNLAEDAHLDPNFAEKLLNFIISEVIQHHKAWRRSRVPSTTRTLTRTESPGWKSGIVFSPATRATSS